MKKLLKAFGILTFLGGLAAAAYYFVFMRVRKPQVELYFDDGSMLALPGDAPEAEGFVGIAMEILEASPVGR